jgi:excisionase family DNA binding protein
MLTRQFLTVKEVADLLKVGEATVRHWIKGGELRAFDVGREWRIAPGDLESFLQRHATTPPGNGKAPPGGSVTLPAQEWTASPGEVKGVHAEKDQAD